MAYSSASWINSRVSTSDSPVATSSRPYTARSRTNPAVPFTQQDLEGAEEEPSRVLPSSSQGQRNWLKSPQIRIEQATPTSVEDETRENRPDDPRHSQSSEEQRRQDLESGRVGSQGETTATPRQSSTRGEPPPDRRDGGLPPAETRPDLAPHSTSLRTLYTISYLIFFSMWGTLARLGTQWLTFYPGTPIVTPVIWANFGGSMILGFLAADQRLFRDEWFDTSTGVTEKHDEAGEEVPKAERTKQKKLIPLYVGIGTGFCGSFTSFSSFARDFFLALSNNLPTPINHPYPQSSRLPSTSSTVSRNGGYSFQASLAVVIYTIALALGGLMLGAHMASELQRWTPRISIRLARGFLDPLFVVLGFGCWLGALLLAVFPPDRLGGPASRGSWANEAWRGEAIFAIVLAPVGCLLRWYLSLKMNPLVPSFPLGTFAVNMFGTAVEAMCWDIQHVGVGVMGRVGGGQTGCQILQGVQDGFCGCLTTVSTWVAEINGLKRRQGYAYGFFSVLGALGLTVVIMGSVRWGVGWSEPVCSTGYTSKLYG